MDSINANQGEDNHRDVQGAQAIERVRQIVEQAESCFFCTAVSEGGSGGARPMAVQDVDSQGSLWFLSASDSHKNQEISRDPNVRLYFQGSSHAGFAHLTGAVTVTTDRAKIKHLWKPILKTWFTDGVDDPRITVLKFVPEGGYYWDNKHGSLVAGIKMLVGAAIGKTLDDSIEGTVKVAPKRSAMKRPAPGL